MLPRLLKAKFDAGLREELLLLKSVQEVPLPMAGASLASNPMLCQP